ncbi:MAG: hypothetical protein ABIO29_07125 [Sphingomicrobium sp.]
MPAAIKLILAAAFAAPALGGCSGEQNPDQNLVITDNVPADAEIEALPADEGGNAAETDGNAN